MMKNKGNDGSGNNLTRDEWETKQSFWNLLNKQYKFGFDCCANPTNTKTSSYSNNFQNIKIINEVAWMNPPFSIARKMFEHFFKVVKKGVAIYRIDNPETKIYQEVIFQNADWIFIPKGRINYESYKYNRNKRGGTRFPSALIGIGVKYPINIDGVILRIK